MFANLEYLGAYLNWFVNEIYEQMTVNFEKDVQKNCQ